MSLLTQLLPKNNVQNQNIFLQGPPNTNKTTISMNLAHILSKDTCTNCQQNNSISPCNCCSILYILPKHKKSNIFPIPFCRAQEANDIIGNTDETTTFWKADHLKRIHIKYIPSNLSILLSCILKIPTLSQHLQPDKGIIVEDLHEFIMGENHAATSRRIVLDAQEMMKLVQVVTLLISTANHLSHKRNFLTLCTINSQTLPPVHAKNILWNYITTYISIQPRTNRKKQGYDWILSIEEEDHDNNAEVIGNMIEKQLYFRMDEENELLVWDLLEL